jgi:hypothetical protein
MEKKNMQQRHKVNPKERFLNDQHQCSRAKEGKPIRVRVICKAAAVSNPRIFSATTCMQIDKN